MVGSRPLVLQQASTTDAAAQEPLADKTRAPAPAPVAMRGRSPGSVIRDSCTARAHQRARRQQTIGERWG